MDVNRSHRGGRDTSSPDRAKICRLKQKVLKQQPSRKVQVVYYLSRNGLLEHPHFMEVTLSANQPLRLKDVFDRLMALRGSGMPSQYSWSSKRNYKSGYVWYDLALKDIIHPSEGGEFVLKGSELVEGCSERFQQLNVGNKQAIHQQPEQNYSYNNANKSKALFSGGGGQQKEAEPEDQYEEYEEQEKEYEDGEKTSYTSSTTTPHSRCSRGVSTEELDEEEHVDAAQNNNKTKAVTTTTNRISAQSHSHVTHAPPPRDPSNNSTTTLAEKLNQRERRVVHHSKRFGEGSTESGAGSNTGVGVTSAAPASRYSVLLQLIACGSGMSSSSGEEIKAKSQEARLSNVGTNNKKQRESVDDVVDDDDAHDHHLHKQKQKKKPLGDNTDDEMMHYCVSENPRLLGNLQSEEKEYFSGSLVESMKANRVAFEAHPVLLKRSNSYNEERRSKLGMEEVKRREMEEDKRETKGGVREKCIPLKKSSKESRSRK